MNCNARCLTVAVMLLAAAGLARVAAAACPGASDAVKAARATSDAAAGARDALVLARRAAQDWKNLLLRGGDALERQRVQARFDAQAQGYERQLSRLGAQLQGVGAGRDLLVRLEEERKRMFAAYRLALETRGVNDLTAAALADRDVQGVDVPTFRTLEELIGILDKRADEQFERAFTAIGLCGGSKMSMDSKQTSQTMTDSTKGPVRIVVPFPPGGIDLILQPMLPALAREIGREVSIVNRPGGTGAVGTGEVARAKADGSTLLFASQGPLVYQPQVNTVDYDVQRSFVPVCRVTSTPSVLMVSAGSGLNSVKEVVAAARAAPGRLIYSSPGPGGLPHIGMAAFEKLLGIELRHLPLAGAAAAIAALKEGKANLLAEQLPTAIALAGQGARIVGVFAASRQASLPDVPTLLELGYEISFQSWNALMAPAGTSSAVIDAWSRACRAALESAASELSRKMGMAPAYLGPADTSAFIAGELVQARALAIRSGLAAQK